MKIETNHRFYYWGTMLPLAAMILFLYSEYKDQEKIISDSQRIYNRQIELITMSYEQRIKKLTLQSADKRRIIIRAHSDGVYELIGDLKEGESVEFLTTILED